MIGGEAGRPPSNLTLDNWQTGPQLSWAFQHIADLFPTAAIPRGSGPVAELTPQPSLLSDVPVTLYDGTILTVGAIMAASDTDGWIVMHDRRVLAEDYPHGMPHDARHLLMSVSKSFVGVVAGALAAKGALDVEQPLSKYVPALASTGYAGATVRQVLDMRSGIAFSEDYLDAGAEVKLLEQAIGWAPRRDPNGPATMYDFLLTLRRKAPHGGPFEYRSGESDVLGWVCEAASGMRMPELMSQLLWSRLGAEFDAHIAVDSAGTGMFDGGISAALQDLTRFGAMILDDGVSLTGERVVPASWVQDTFTGTDDARAAFAACAVDNGMPGGMYRNQFWIPYPSGIVLLCLGIHGQMIYVNRPARVVAAKLSSWPIPQDAWKLFATLRAFDAVSAQLHNGVL